MPPITSAIAAIAVKYFLVMGVLVFGFRYRI
jgi:hypothetical protein